MCEVYDDFLRSEGEEVAEEIVQELPSINVIIRDDLKVDFWQQVGNFNEVITQNSKVIFLKIFRLKRRGFIPNYFDKGTIKMISIADCFALTLANREGAILLTSNRKEFEPIIPLNICQIDFIR